MAQPGAIVVGSANAFPIDRNPTHPTLTGIDIFMT
jgi:hypothetical protein